MPRIKTKPSNTFTFVSTSPDLKKWTNFKSTNKELRKNDCTSSVKNTISFYVFKSIMVIVALERKAVFESVSLPEADRSI